MTGPLIGQSGTGNNDLSIAFGDALTGFWRAGTTLILSVGGQPLITIDPVTGIGSAVELRMGGRRITTLADPRDPDDAVTKHYADALQPDIDFSDYLRRDGGAMTGPLFLVGDPTIADQAATKRYADALMPDLNPYLRRDGGQMTGPLVTTSGTGLTNPGLAIGDNATGFYRSGNVLIIGVSGSMVAQLFVDDWMMTVPLNMALQRIYNVANATADTDALNRRTADARYLRRDGGTMDGTLITVPGTGQNDLGLGIGDGNTGFYRAGSGTGADLMLLVAGYPMLILTGTREAVISGPLSMALNRIFNLAAPTLANDAATKNYVDQRRATTVAYMMTADLALAADFRAIMLPTGYNIPRGGNSRVMVTLVGGLRFGSGNQIGMAQVRLTPGNIVHNIFAYSVADGANVEGSGVNLSLMVDVTGANPQIGLEIRQLGGTSAMVLAGSTSDPQRTIVTIQDLGAI
jgi:hypothetical protein